LVYLSILLIPNSYIVLFWKFYFLPFSVHAQTTVIYLTLLSLLQWVFLNSFINLLVNILQFYFSLSYTGPKILLYTFILKMFICRLSLFVSTQIAGAYVNVLSVIVFFSLNFSCLDMFLFFKKIPIHVHNNNQPFTSETDVIVSMYWYRV
jgi:hypothetical protein